MPSWRRAALIALGLSAAACRTGYDYRGPGPRYAGTYLDSAAKSCAPCTLRIVSFNTNFARDVEGAIALFTSDPAIRDPDILLLQEMDAAGTETLAKALRRSFVYYPAIFHRRTQRDVGNAVLSRWPIVEDVKLVLPNPSRYAETHRIATAATLLVGASKVRVYSTHLGTFADIAPSARQAQLRFIIADAAKYPFVIIGGDLNDSDVGLVAQGAGYSWPTQYGPRTHELGRWDHIFLKGAESPDSAAAGTILDSRGVSDHHPVWALAILQPE
ncbi:MAG TPA: endonuclease/exonuclease/phosphatase family protein [Gemmatimonadaceae bacterium]|nr:endonuclease/exonuclease/phosphatase family protein [Gemmatimonadaceae bacterium]